MAIKNNIIAIGSFTLLMLSACTADNNPVAEQEITLTTPVIELGEVSASASRAVTHAGFVSDTYLHVWLHNSDARVEAESRHGYISYSEVDECWYKTQPVSVTGGEGNYRAGIIVPVSWGNYNNGDFVPKLAYAIYGYRGSISVTANGTFTPADKLVPYSAGVQVILQDANGSEISSIGNYYTIKPVGLARMAMEQYRGYTDLDVDLPQSFVEGDDGERFPNGTAPAVPAAKTFPSMIYNDVACGFITPGTYPATWTEGGALTSSAAPSAPWSLFEVTYCAEGFESSNGDYVPKGTISTWTVSYPARQLTLEAGKLYTFTIGLGKDAHITLASGAVTIANWAAGSTINVGK